MGDGGVIGMAGFQPTACADCWRSCLPLPPELASAGPSTRSAGLDPPVPLTLASRGQSKGRDSPNAGISGGMTRRFQSLCCDR